MATGSRQIRALTTSRLRYSASCVGPESASWSSCSQQGDHVGSSAHDYAKSACNAYQHVGRVQVAATTAQSAAIRDVARSDVRAAAVFDPRWAQLSSDMLDALDLWATSSDRFFEVDKRVQDECSDAGRVIGDLKPGLRSRRPASATSRRARSRPGSTVHRAWAGVQRRVMSGRFSMLRSPSLVSRTVKPWRS